MKIHTLNYIDKEGRGRIEAFTSNAKARARMNEIKETAEFVDGVDMVDFPGNRQGLMEAIEWASTTVYK